jgi:hypothetical protein
MAEQEEDFVDEMNNSIISPMFAVSHAPGNFGLVPAYYNCHRGTSGLIHDYLPQSLFFLKTTDKEDFSIVKKLSAYTRNSEYKNGMANEYFQEYSNSMFPKYINTMFFWDLVKPGDDGELTIIDYAGNAIDELSGEFEESDLKMWAQGSELFIKRRGMFIAALLYAYYFYNSEFEEIKKLLFIDETITVDNKYGYEAVFRLIEKSITNVNVKLVFKCVEDLFKEKK